MQPMHRTSDQKTAIAETIAAIKKFTGRPPRGWESPGLTETDETLDLLANPSPVSASSRHLRLYVAGKTQGAARALEDRLHLIEATGGTIQIEIIDILARPSEAEAAGILATPTLSDESADPPRRLIGDLSDLNQVLGFFGYNNKDSRP